VNTELREPSSTKRRRRRRRKGDRTGAGEVESPHAGRSVLTMGVVVLGAGKGTGGH